MRNHLHKALIHGLSLAKRQHQNFDTKDIVSTILPDVIKSTLIFNKKVGDSNRNLIEYDDNMMSGNGDGDDMFFQMLMGDDSTELAEQLSQCDINLQDIMEKFFESPDLMSMMMGTGDEDGDDMMTSMMQMMGNGGGKGGSTMMEGGLDPNLFVNLLADDDEVACTEVEQDQFSAALSSFNTCTGIDELIGVFAEYSDEDVSSLISTITTGCVSLTDSFLGEDDTEFAYDFNKCMEVILDDNPIGNFIRDIYHHPDKWCKCYNDLGSSVPSCLFQVEPVDGGASVMMDVNVQMSGSATKKIVCLVGLGCDMIEDLCLSELYTLDSCLPEADGSETEEFTCFDVFSECEFQGSFTVLSPPFTEITRSALPDTCQRVYSENKNQLADAMIIDRYSHFGSVCNGFSDNSSESEQQQEEEKPEAVNTSVAATSSSEIIEEKEIENDDGESSSSSFVIPAIVAIAIAATATAALLIRSRKRGRVGSVATFSQIGSVDTDIDKDCELTVSTASFT